ncbi:MAG: hypothetical protein D6781_06815, partial [Verrucomicrobia bacterium]
VRADIYSLGRILYEMTTGRPPTDFPLLPDDLSTRPDAAVVLELNEVILRACAQRPEDRYADAGEMLEDLLLIEAGKSVKELFRIRRRLRELSRYLAWGAAAAGVVLLGLGIHDYMTTRELAASEHAARLRAEQDEKLARYTADLNLAQLDLDSGNLGGTRSALRRARTTVAPPGLEWHALNNDTRGNARRVLGESNNIPARELVVAPGGNRLAVQYGDRKRQTAIWDLQTGSRRILSRDAYRLAGFSPDGTAILQATSAGALQRINLSDGAADVFAPPRENIIQRETNSRYLATGRRLETGFQITRWDAESLSPAGTWAPDTAQFPATGYSANILDHAGRRLALVLLAEAGASRRRQLVVADLETGATLLREDAPGNIQSLAFSPDGSRLISAGVNLPVRIRDLQHGEPAIDLPALATDIYDLEVSPDNRHLAAACGDQVIRIWDLDTLAAPVVMRDHEGEVTVIRWIDENTLASASRDGTVRIWDIGRPAPVLLAGGFWDQILGDIIDDPVNHRWFATMADGTISAIDVETLAPEGRRLPAFHPLAFDEGQLLALDADLSLLRIDPRTGAVEPTSLTLTPHPRTTKALASPRGEIAAFGRGDGSLVIWDCRKGTVLFEAAVHSQYIWALATDEAGNRVASGSRDGSIILWDRQANSAAPIAEPGPREVTALAFAPDGKTLLVGRSDGSIDAIDIASRQTVRSQHPHTKSVAWITVSPDRQRIVSGSYGGLVAVFDANLSRLLAHMKVRPFDAPRGDYAVSRLRIARDGSTMVVLTQNGHVRRWWLHDASPTDTATPARKR